MPDALSGRISTRPGSFMLTGLAVLNIPITKGVMMKQSFMQANREAFMTLGLYLLFFLWWTVTAFGFGSGHPDEYSYILGLPAWFFLSCLVGWPVITLLLWVVIRVGFRDVPLDGQPDGAASKKGAAHE